jgi:hypothetical protein
MHHIATLVLIIWLVIGGIAAGQRGYFHDTAGNCGTAGTVVVTILAGPLNYMGVNPKVSCTTHIPQPSR